MEKAFKLIIPPLTFDSYKGQAGRIGIVGGSKNYTGAPYFAAISALKVGCDLCHVFCTSDASQAIKSYSPELIVHPILDSPHFAKEISTYLPLLDSLVIGPGLGRDETHQPPALTTFQAVSVLVKLAIKQGLPLVFDADGLFYLQEHHKEIVGYEKAILTPNTVEFERLYKSMTGREVKVPKLHERDEDDRITFMALFLAQELDHVTFVIKGKQDFITDGEKIVDNVTPGSLRRCGGQGDVLSGIMGVFHYWAYKAKKDNPSRISYNPSVLAASMACAVTRKCSYLTFQKYKRSMLTSDMIAEIGEAFSSLYEN